MYLVLPFAAGNAVLSLLGRLRIRRNASRLEIFQGVGPIGWNRRYNWSDFHSVLEDLSEGRHRHRFIRLAGARSASFGSLLNKDRRYFVIQVLKRELARR